MRDITYAELFLRNQQWIARYTSEPERSRIIALFGTAEVPTAFSAPMSYDDVRHALNCIPANARTCFVEARRQHQ